jgi:N utilization substance protein A
LAARLTGWRVDIKSETQLAEEEAYASDEWAQGEWIIDPQSGAQMWQPADGGPPISAEDWADKGGDDAPGSDGASEGAAAPDGDQADEPTADADGSGGSDEARPAEAEPAGVPPETEAPPTADPAETGEGVS